MTKNDQGDYYKSTLNLVKKFVESTQRKRLNLLSEVESEFESSKLTITSGFAEL